MTVDGLLKPLLKAQLRAPPRLSAVSVIRLHRFLRRSRRDVTLAVVLVATAGLVALHHGVPMDMHEMPAAAVCLAVLGAGVAVAVAAGALFAPRLALPVDWLVPIVWLTEPRSVPARAGPLYLRLAVLRR
jgi:hypothetical protein